MKEETKKLRDIFQQITKRKPKSARQYEGSMRPYICFKMEYTLEIRDFCKNENYYQKNQKTFRGLPIKWLGNTFDENYHIKNGYDFIVLKELLKV